MSTSEQINLTRRGQLLRFVSPAIRCLNQVPTKDTETWIRDAHRFKERIHSEYSDVLEHLPVEFEPWLQARAGGLYSAEQQQQMNKVLERLGHDIQDERRA